jgi:rhamnogalacturonan endolyase
MKQSTYLQTSNLLIFLSLGLLSVAMVAPAGVATAQEEAARAANAPVKVIDSDNSVTLENGLITLKINKANANVLSLQYKGMDLVDGSGYWNVYGNSPDGPKTEKKPDPQPVEITQDPVQNGGHMGEVKINMPYTGQAGTEPLDIAIRYALRRGDSAIYCWTSVTHKPGYPAFNVEISTVTLKLKADIFDHLNIDSRRDKEMIAAQDWFQGTRLNLAEARLMTTGIHAGEVEHKYDYSALLADTPAWGWTSTKKNVGVWYVVPSLEYINGPPTKVELTGHIDLKNSLPADPTLLFIWHGSHYGGVPIYIGQDEYWNKVVGPFVIYCNTGPTPDAMWKDALARAAVEKKEWPYAWVKDPGYATPAERGAVHGQLVVKDPQQTTATAANAWVGLAAAPYTGVDGNRKPYPITWQIDGKHYQYWVHADKNGTFTIPDARPGTYGLYAFNDGILGEFSKVDLTVEAGKTKDVGKLTWVPARYGQQIWQIGTPDRSAAEFRHGDHYWEWGLYNKYPKEFPNGVNFVIGKSNPATDWDYAQPPTMGADGHWHGTTWHILFDMANVPAGKATLRLAICGSRGNSVDISVNGKPIGGTGPLPNSGVMHRDGIRSIETEVDLPFDSSMLVPGKNQIDLTATATDWTQGVLYDYLRLELAPENSTVAKAR